MLFVCSMANDSPQPALEYFRHLIEYSELSGLQEKIEKAAAEGQLLQKYSDELRSELQVDSCVISQIIHDPTDPHVLGIKESLTPGLGLGTRLIRHEIDQEMLNLLQMHPDLAQQLNLTHEVSVTIHDIEELRQNPKLAQLWKLSYPFPERAFITAPLIYENNIQGLVICSQLAPRRWDTEDCTVIKDISADISVALQMYVKLSSDLATSSAEEVSSGIHQDGFASVLPPKLSEQHLHILKLIDKGLTNKEIRKETDISYRMVRHRVGEMMQWTSSDTRTALAHWARKQGIVN
jgi:DNA-binding CsgD family transcriptional regulator